MKVLLSIKPEFAYKIFDGSKKFEFRKAIFKNANITSVVVYASSPVQQVIGEFEIDKILHSDPEALWQQTATQSGITKEYFDKYFTDKEYGYAIKIKKTRKYKVPRCLRNYYNLLPPQSFRYFP